MTIISISFARLGGILIGAASSGLLLVNGRIAGISGPGPALVSLVTLSPAVIVFVVTMGIGFTIGDRAQHMLAREQPLLAAKGEE